MSFDKLAEEKIREAIAAGEFDDLPGKGKPLNLDEYFAVDEEWRVGLSLLKNSGFLPQEMQLLKDIAELRESLERTNDPSQRQTIQCQILESTTQYDLLMERRPNRKGSRPRR